MVAFDGFFGFFSGFGATEKSILRLQDVEIRISLWGSISHLYPVDGKWASENVKSGEERVNPAPTE